MAQPPAEREQRRKRRRRRPSAERRRPGVLLKEFWNAPNLLTFGRILIIPLFIDLAYQANPLASLLAGALFAVAAITDVVDGWLARRMGLVTVIGKFLDPLADKLIVLAAMVMLVRLGRFPAWVAILLLSREFVVTGLRQIAASEGMVIAAGQEGKWKTALQLVGIVALLRALPARAGPLALARAGELQRRGAGADLPQRDLQRLERGGVLPRVPADACPPRRRQRLGGGLTRAYRVVNGLVPLMVWKPTTEPWGPAYASTLAKGPSATTPQL